MISVSDPLRVRFFSQSLTGPAFGWYTSLGPDSIRTWKQLEEQFHVQYHSEAAEAGIADLAQLRQKRGETVAEFIRRFREMKNRCYSTRISEKEAVELASVGLLKPIRDLAFQLEFTSLAHLVQKLSTYEQRHPELYQDKFKRQVAVADTEEADDSEEEMEVSVAEWARGANPVPCKWLKQTGPAKGFDFDVSKVEQIFDLLLKEKQLKFPEGHKLPTAQELKGRSYCKWHDSFTHGTNDCKELRRQIQSAIEQGRLILGKTTMKVDTQPFPGVNMVEQNDRSARRQLDFALGINMAGMASRCRADKNEADSSNRPQKEEKEYVTEERVRYVRNQRPTSSDLLRKYEYQYRQRLQRESEDEEYEHRTGKRLKKHEDARNHWHCPFFRYCWDSGMSRLPTIRDCPECAPMKMEARESVFGRLGYRPAHQEQVRSPRREEEEEDRCHRPRWCPDGLNRSQKRRVQRLRSLEEAEARYIETLRKARPDLAEQVHREQEKKPRTSRKEWRPKSTRADKQVSADTHMVFVLPAEFHARTYEEPAVAQLDLGPRPVIFEKPQAKNYKHLKALYLKGYINGQPINKMLVDTGAAVNIMPYSVLRRLGRSTGDLIKTNVTLSDFNGQTSEAQGVLSVDLTIGSKTVPTSFFVVNSKSTYNILLGRDWIHTNCCIPSTMHQCLIQWDGDEVEVVQADDSIEISHAAMSIWDAEDQEPISGISLEGCDRIEATKNGVRLVLSTGLTE
jgi:hypothetical protein